MKILLFRVLYQGHLFSETPHLGFARGVRAFVGGQLDLAFYPKGPSSPYLWFWVPIKAPKSLNNEYLDP